MKKNNIITIIKKELRRFFTDPRVVLSMVLPGVLLYILYSLMGNFMFADPDRGEPHTYTVYAENLPESVETMLKDMPVTFLDSENPKADLQDKTLDLYAVFPKNFDKDVLTEGKTVPQVSLFYRSTEKHSAEAYSLMENILSNYETMLSNRFDVNADLQTQYDLSTKEDISSMMFGSLMPMLINMLLFTTCMTVAPESIAGEKERGTIATLLVTPMKRRDLAIGKIISLSAISLLGGVCSFIGVLLSLPKLMGGMGDSLLSGSVYTATDYIAIFVVMISMLLLFVSILSVISALSRTVKEATGYISPLILVVTVLGISGIFGGGEPMAHSLYAIPIFNGSQCISGIFTMQYSPVDIAITVGSNLLATLIFIYILTRLFNSEKIMFQK